MARFPEDVPAPVLASLVGFACGAAPGRPAEAGVRTARALWGTCRALAAAVAEACPAVPRRLRVVAWHQLVSCLGVHGNGVCPICHQQLLDCCIACSAERGEEPCDVARGRCGHAYHAHCIDRWLRTRHTCPMDDGPWEPALPVNPIAAGDGEPPSELPRLRLHPSRAAPPAATPGAALLRLRAELEAYGAGPEAGERAAGLAERWADVVDAHWGGSPAPAADAESVAGDAPPPRPAPGAAAEGETADPALTAEALLDWLRRARAAAEAVGAEALREFEAGTHARMFQRLGTLAGGEEQLALETALATELGGNCQSLLVAVRANPELQRKYRAACRDQVPPAPYRVTFDLLAANAVPAAALPQRVEADWPPAVARQLRLLGGALPEHACRATPLGTVQLQWRTALENGVPTRTVALHVTPLQATALLALDAAGTASPAYVAREAGLAIGVLSAALKPVTRAGVVRRLDAEADARGCLLRLNDARGARVARKLVVPAPELPAEPQAAPPPSQKLLLDALVVHTFKHFPHLRFADLVGRVQAKAPAHTPRALRACLDRLLERDYIGRDAADPTLFHFLP